MTAYGGETPLIDFGLRITVEAPVSTSVTVPVEAGDIFKLGSTAADGSGYKAVNLVAGDDCDEVVMVQALHRITSVGPMGVSVLGKYQQIRRLTYTAGSVPVIGQSVIAKTGTVRTVESAAFNSSSYVLLVDTNALMAEVLV